MKKTKLWLATIAKKSIITFEFIWATWWAWLVIMAGILGICMFAVTNQTKFLFGILAIIAGVWYVVKEWKDYLEEYGKH